MVGRGDKTGRQMGLKASVRSGSKRKCSRNSEEGQCAAQQQGLGRDGWFVEQLVLELSS